MVAVIKTVVANSWRGGIQMEGPTENAYEIKLHGSPWHAEADQGIQARLLLAKIISALAQQHWVFHAAANMKSTSDSLFFKYDPEAAAPQLINHHFVISLNRSDRLRLIDAPQALIPVVRQVIISVWTAMGGIQQEQDYYGSWEFKLSGNPWQSYGNYDAVMGRFLICKILEALRGQGWDVKTSIDVSRSQKDKNILVMTPSHHPDTTPVMCLSFSGKDKIRLINAPRDLVGVCREILMSRLWTRGIAREEQMQTSCSSYEFKLNGCPWHGTYSNETLQIQSALCYIIQALTARGWKYITSADVSAKYEKEGENGPTYPVDVHSWWFAYEPQAAAQPTESAFKPLSTTPVEPTPTFMPPPTWAQSTEPAFMSPPPSYEEVMKQSN